MPRTHRLRTAPASIQTPAGTRIPEADVLVRQIAREAGRWRAFAGEHSRMQPAALDAKALDACAFSVHQGAASLAVPSKLVGTSRHPLALRALAAETHASQAHASQAWLALDLDDRGDALVVSHGGRTLGRVQPKHLPWVRPLVPFGLAVFLSRVTGGAALRAAEHRSGRDATYRLGCNVAFGHVGKALARRADAVGGGAGGDGARSPLRLVVPGEARPLPAPVATEALPAPEATRDVVLWRTSEGDARASVAHVVRHSPTGIEWGYLGSGPADLAFSILAAVSGERAAAALYQRFKADVVARMPRRGGRIRVADVRDWVARAAA